MRHLTLSLPGGKSLQMDAPEHLHIPWVLESQAFADYEPDTLATTLAMLSLRDGVFVDVGANVGVFSLLVGAVLGREVHAYEPLPDASEVLRQTARAHELPVRVSNLALSDRTGSAEFYVSAKSDLSSSLNRRFRKAKSTLDVELAPLDEVIGDVQPGLVKIDTETTEPAVLAGAVSTLERHKPPLIVEVLRHRTEEALQSFFEGRGYRWYHITGAERWTESGRLRGDSSYEHNNWLFAPEPLGEPFWRQLERWRSAVRAAAG